MTCVAFANVTILVINNKIILSQSGTVLATCNLRGLNSLDFSPFCQQTSKDTFISNTR